MVTFSTGRFVDSNKIPYYVHYGYDTHGAPIAWMVTRSSDNPLRE